MEVLSDLVGRTILLRGRAYKVEGLKKRDGYPLRIVAMRSVDDGIPTTKIVADPEEFLRSVTIIGGRSRLARVS